MWDGGYWREKGKNEVFLIWTSSTRFLRCRKTLNDARWGGLHEVDRSCAPAPDLLSLCATEPLWPARSLYTLPRTEPAELAGEDAGAAHEPTSLWRDSRTPRSGRRRHKLGDGGGGRRGLPCRRCPQTTRLSTSPCPAYASPRRRRPQTARSITSLCPEYASSHCRRSRIARSRLIPSSHALHPASRSLSAIDLRPLPHRGASPPRCRASPPSRRRSLGGPTTIAAVLSHWPHGRAPRIHQTRKPRIRWTHLHRGAAPEPPVDRHGAARGAAPLVASVSSASTSASFPVRSRSSSAQDFAGSDFAMHESGSAMPDSSSSLSCQAPSAVESRSLLPCRAH
jgi:hypothetical protein